MMPGDDVLTMHVARRIEVFTGAGQQRRWSAEAKAQIVAESYEASVGKVADRYSLAKTQVFIWRRDARRSAFAQVVVDDAALGSGEAAADGAIEFELVGARVRIGREADARLAVAARPVDFRKGAGGLAGLVREQMAADPFCGTDYVFRAKRADRIKLIYWMRQEWADR